MGWSTAWAHPRGCGEHLRALISLAGRWGSSPRVRGTLAKWVEGAGSAGLIPAGAGNIATGHTTKPAYWAHPRGCGEHGRDARSLPVAWGSSPRVRGTYYLPLSCRPVQGLIPAGAGNIFLAIASVCLYRAHPRGCGEHPSRNRVSGSVPGSSPRVRGTCLRLRVWRLCVGLIPAGAGNIRYAGSSVASYGAHPRGCGEHDILRGSLKGRRGSSPRVRGT